MNADFVNTIKYEVLMDHKDLIIFTFQVVNKYFGSSKEINDLRKSDWLVLNFLLTFIFFLGEFVS